MNRSRFRGALGGPGNPTAFAALTDSSTVNLPVVNAPLAAALAAQSAAADAASTAATAAQTAAAAAAAAVASKADTPGPIITKAASATLAFSELGHNRTVKSVGVGPHTFTLGTDFPADADVVVLPESNLAATFTVVAGAGHAIYVPPDCSVASATAQGGIVSLRYLGGNTWICTSPARVEAGSGGGAPTSRTLLAATAVAAAGTATAVASTAPKTVECKVAATGSGSIVARFDVFASFDAGATYTRIDTLFVTGADAAGAQRSIVFNAQFTHIRVDLVSLETTGVTAATATALGIW